MNIVQIPRRFVRSYWGGTETVILETCKRLLEMGHHTEIICPNALAQKDREVMGGIRISRVPYFYPYLGLSDAAKQLLDRKGGNLFSFALMRVLKQYPDLDLIHLHTAKRPGGIGRYVATKRGIPYVVSLHGGMFDVPDEEVGAWTAPTKGAFEWGKILGWWVGSRRVLEDAAAILCVGQEEQRQTLRRFPEKRVLHLPNGVDPDRFAVGNREGFRKQYQIPLDALVMLMVGRMDPQKNQLFAVDALPQLIQITPRVHLVMVGPVTNAPYSRKVSLRIDAAGLQDRVTVIDGLDAESQELVDAYHGADIFLLPSIHEPFGIVILEAWAAGLPVIATRVGGIPSFVNDGRDGFLFDVNDPGGLLNAFKILLEAPEKTHELIMAGRVKARTQYSWDTVTQSLVKIYEEAVREHPFRQ
ncbi:MAG: glycosyltransferase family 4 protein [Deltaproteobacteria bacterium]|nr:glycosyltransferase family 4 protein [Deltaproteobacteria bacterium]